MARNHYCARTEGVIVTDVQARLEDLDLSAPSRNTGAQPHFVRLSHRHTPLLSLGDSSSTSSRPSTNVVTWWRAAINSARPPSLCSSVMLLSATKNSRSE